MQSSRNFRCAQQYSNMTWNERQRKTLRARVCDNARGATGCRNDFTMAGANLLAFFLRDAARNGSRLRFDVRKAQRGGACDSGIFPVARANQRNFLAARIDRPRRKLLANAAEPSGDQFAHAAPKDNYIGLEEIHNIAEPDRQQVSGLLQN